MRVLLKVHLRPEHGGQRGRRKDCRFRHVDAVEPGGRHTHDRDVVSVQDDRFMDDLRVAAESGRPERMTQHDGGRRVGGAAVGGGEARPDGRRYPKHVEVVARDQDAFDALRGFAAERHRPPSRVRHQSRERVRLVTIGPVFGNREQTARTVDRTPRPAAEVLIDADECVGIRYRQRPPGDAVEQWKTPRY